jgi:tetratricopeptide (TPR) repeat protein
LSGCFRVTADSRARALAASAKPIAGQGALMKRVRVFFIIAASLVWLPGCETSNKLTDLFRSGNAPSEATATDPSNPADPADPEPTGTVSGPPAEPAGSNTALLGTDPKDDLSVAKHHFRQENYGLAEHYFRRAAESHPRDGEAWLGLAASYDRLKRFELADRAYKQALAIAGPTPEVLNNLGFSYMLRGDYKRARAKLAEARALDPQSPYILNNIKLLEESARKGKSIQN